MKKFIFLLFCLTVMPSLKAKADPLAYLVNIYHVDGYTQSSDPSSWYVQHAVFEVNYDQLSGIGRDERGVYDLAFSDIPYVATRETYVGRTILWELTGIATFYFERDGIGGPLFTYNTQTPFDLSLDVPPLIEGTYTNGAYPSEWFTITAIGGQTPEPSTWIMFGTGALGLAGSFRRRIFKS